MKITLHKVVAGLAAMAGVMAVGVAFNTTTASAAGTKVADISQYQGNINWSKASKDLKYAIIRVQHGSKGDAGYMVDSKRNVNANGAYKYGVPFGQYMFAEFTSVKDAQQEAKDFYKRSNAHTKFFVLDEEKRMSSAKSSEQTYVNAWLKTMRMPVNIMPMPTIWISPNLMVHGSPSIALPSHPFQERRLIFGNTPVQALFPGSVGMLI